MRFVRVPCIFVFAFLTGCGGGVNILPEPFTRERADGKIPVKTELIRAQVRRELDGMPEGEAEVGRWQAIEVDYNACRLSSARATKAEAEEVFADCMSRRGYVYMLPIDAEQFHNDIAFDLEKERDARLSAKRKAEEERIAAEKKRAKDAERKAEEERIAAEKKAKQDDKDSNLHHWVEKGDIEKVRGWLAEGANVNAVNNDGGTALMFVASKGNAEIVKLLLAAGANVNAVGNNGNAALFFAAFNGNYEEVKMLLVAGANSNAKNNDGGTALMWAVNNGHAEIAKLLLSARAYVNAADNEGWTALFFAAWKGHSEIAKLLLSAGAYVNKRNNDGWTALMIAARDGHAEVAKILLSAGENLNQRNKNDWTALILAAQKENSDIAALLLSCGANPNIKNNQGNTAWDWAKQNLSVLSVFEEYQRKLDSGWRPQSCKGGVKSAVVKSPQTNIAENVFAKVWRSVVAIRQGGNQGSGVIVRPNVVATNCHNIESGGNIVVYQHDNRLASSDTLYNASVRHRDSVRDFCLLNVGGLNGTPAKVRRYDTLKIGEDVYAVGSPQGLDLSLSSGLISQFRQGDGLRYIQTDAAISPGSSGGGLFDSDGNLIGITTEKIADETVEGIGFAIPADLAIN